MNLQQNLTTSQGVVYQASPTDANGNPVGLDGPLQVTVISGTAGSVLFTPGSPEDPNDPLAVTLWAPDAAGELVLQIQGDADLSAGVTLIGDTVTLDATGAVLQASSLNGSLTELVQKPGTVGTGAAPLSPAASPRVAAARAAATQPAPSSPQARTTRRVNTAGS